MLQFESYQRFGDVPPGRGERLVTATDCGQPSYLCQGGERKVISIPVSIPVHGNKDLKPGLALRIARDAGIKI